MQETAVGAGQLHTVHGAACCVATSSGSRLCCVAAPVHVATLAFLLLLLSRLYRSPQHSHWVGFAGPGAAPRAITPCACCLAPGQRLALMVWIALLTHHSGLAQGDGLGPNLRLRSTAEIILYALIMQQWAADGQASDKRCCSVTLDLE
jgi:hypothetical protein